MNAETLNLVQRPYLEIVDDLMTAAAGGVVNEPIFFDVKADLYPLAEPAQGVRGITGTAAKRHHAFLLGVDFEFSEGDNAVAWLEGATQPDDETLFYVDYFRRDSRSPLTDLNVGSVTRTLMEAIGRETAVVYQQINLAYLAAFLDTATGKSLDLVVSILGIERKSGEFATGLVTFFRDPAVTGNINLPEGTKLVTTKGEAIFEITEPRTLQRGQARIDVPVRAAEGFAGEAGLVVAGAITEMAQPVAGISRVSNVEATVKAARDENDEELRLRARAALRALGKATLFSLDRVIRENRGRPVEFYDPAGPPAKRSAPGTVAVLVEAESERLPGLRGAVEITRAAGVRATVVARSVFMKPRLVARLSVGLTAAGKDKVKDEIIASLQTYVDGLESGEPAVGTAMLEAVKEVEDVSEIQFVDVVTWRADLGGAATDKGSEILADRLLDALDKAQPAKEQQRAALVEILDRSQAPTGGRIPDRSLVESTAEGGGRASDADIESAAFRVSATVQGELWWLELDMERADVALDDEAGEEA